MSLMTDMSSGSSQSDMSCVAGSNQAAPSFSGTRRRRGAHTYVLVPIQVLRARRGGYGPSQRAKALNLATALSDGSAVKHALMGHGISLPE
jgi:hypothetical protein